MNDTLIEELISRVAKVAGSLTTLGRLHAFRNLSGCDVIAREDASRDFAICIEASAQLEDFAHRYYNARRGTISWPLQLKPDLESIVADGEVDYAGLEIATAKVSRTARGLIESLRATAKKSVLTRPLFEILKQIEFPVPNLLDGESSYSDLSFDYCDSPVKVLRGPTAVHLGPHFKPNYSVTDRKAPEFGDTIEQNVPFFWIMAARETLASQMCALSAVEYDGLPLAFYSDMAKQCWDEARHSLSFVRLANIATARERGDSYHTMESVANIYRAEAGGFEIPIEGNFYEAMLNADLVQRLVLMNQRSEAPAIPFITKRLGSSFCQKHESVNEFYQFDRIDETSHASIGHRWLRYLVPDESERSKRAEEADLLRAMLMLTSFVHHGGGTLDELAERFLREGAGKPGKQDSRSAALV